MRTGLRSVTIFVWACAGFFVPFLLLFVAPVFFAGPAMSTEAPVPWLSPIAVDLHLAIDFGRLWLNGSSPYNGLNLYPPLATLLFAAWAGMGFETAHIVLTVVTVALVFTLVIGLALHHSRGRSISPLTALFLFSAVQSYGLLFELERGQFNLLAMGVSLCGVWLFHARPRWRLLAFALFSAGVQLKIYPAILVLLLIDDYRDTVGNLRRAAVLGLVNFVLLFAFGPRLFADWLHAFGQLAFQFSGPANHSIDSFSAFAAETLARHWSLPESFPALVRALMLVSLGGCLVTIFLLNRRDKRPGLDPYLLLACSIGALLIPPISYDYKLSLLVPAVALAALEFERTATDRHPGAFGLAAFVFMVAAYTTTLYSFAFKPTMLDNNCPALLVMLACVTVLGVLRSAVGHAAPPQITAAAVG